MTIALRDGRPALADLYQRAPCRVLFPRIDGSDGAEVVLLNTAGGVTGGDRLAIALRAETGATLTATTQAAEKIYRALDRPGRIATTLTVADGATMEWLPQETILFDGGRLDRLTEAHIGGQARLLALEWLVLGRAAHGETVRHGGVTDRWRVRRDGRLIWADSFRLAGDIAAQTRHAALLAGCAAVATLLYAAPDAARQVERVRPLLAGLDAHAGATTMAGLLICRLAAAGGDQLRRAVIRFLHAFRAELDGLPPALPRLWAC